MVMSQPFRGKAAQTKFVPFVLWPWFKKELDIPVIAAGGIATGAGVAGAMALGADLAYVGTRFIASPEAQVNAFGRAPGLQSWKHTLCGARTPGARVRGRTREC